MIDIGTPVRAVRSATPEAWYQEQLARAEAYRKRLPELVKQDRKAKARVRLEDFDRHHGLK